MKNANHQKSNKWTQQAEKDLARDVTTHRSKIAHGAQEAAYLYGFADPSRASRGPMRSEHPTTIATFTSSDTITLVAPTATPGVWNHPSSVLQPKTLTGIPGAATGSINIAVGPTAFCDKRAGTKGTDFQPGFVFSPDAPMNTQAFVAVTGRTALMPFGSYTAPFPCPITEGPNDVIEILLDGETMLSHRVLGVRATLTVNSSLLESYGQIYVLDNGSYFPDAPAQNILRTTSTNESFPTYEDAALYTSSMGHGQHSARTINAGAFKYGKTYESGFVPTNDNILDYRTRFSTNAVATASGSCSKLAQPFLNGPYAIFCLEGVPADAVITISSTVAFEIPVPLDSPIGWALASARLAMNYAVDWSLLGMMPSGGEPGSMVLSLVHSPAGQLGYGIAVDEFNEPPFQRSVATGLTMVSATDVVKSAGLSDSGDIQQDLQDAANPTQTNVARLKGWMADTATKAVRLGLPHLTTALKTGARLYFGENAGANMASFLGHHAVQALTGAKAKTQPAPKPLLIEVAPKPKGGRKKRKQK